MKIHNPDHIMRWLGPSLIGIVGIALIGGNPLTQEYLCEGTQNCLATWVGSLSGWGAVGAAVVTIAFIQRQISETSRHHREMLALELHPKLALAKRGRIDAGRARMVAQDLSKLLDQVKTFPTGYEMIIIVEIAPHLRILTEIFTGPTFDSFENDIGSSMPFGLDEGRQNLRVINDKFDHGYDADRFEGFGQANMHIAISTMQRIVRYCNDCERSAVNYEAQWKSLIS